MRSLLLDCKDIFLESSRLKEKIADDQKFLEEVAGACYALLDCAQKGGTITVCGNGGSACDSMHFAEELISRFKRERPGIKARHLMDAGVISCWANDYNYETVFERQVETLCEPPDTLVLLSTSGNSVNLIRAAEAAKRKGLIVVGLLGKGGGKLGEFCDHTIIVPSQSTERIQEVHLTLIHVFCEYLEKSLFFTS